MKTSIASALLFAAALAAPAHAAFTLNCKTQVSDSGRERPFPAQWTWDGVALINTTTSPTQGEQIQRFKPAHFEKSTDGRAVTNTSYAFVIMALPNGTRIALTLHTSGSGKDLSTTETFGMVSGHGAILNASQNKYRNCSIRES